MGRRDTMSDCKVCGAPIEVEQQTPLAMVDFDGSDGVFELLKVRCAAGHWYNEPGEAVSLGQALDSR